MLKKKLCGPWSDAEAKILAARFPHEKTQGIADDLGRPYQNVAKKASALGLKKSEAFQNSPDSGRTKGRIGRQWSDAETETVRQKFANTKTQLIADELGLSYPQIVHKARELGLKKSEEFLNGPHGGRTDGSFGQAGRFKPGAAPANKGKKYPGRISSTTFKPGQACPTKLPIGSLRIAKSSREYLQIKLTETGYPPKDWVMYHRHVWEQAHGQIPEDHMIRFKPGMRSLDPEKITPEALECVSKEAHMAQHTYHQYGPEIAQLTQLRSAITRQINKRTTKDQP